VLLSIGNEVQDLWAALMKDVLNSGSALLPPNKITRAHTTLRKFMLSLRSRVRNCARRRNHEILPAEFHSVKKRWFDYPMGQRAEQFNLSLPGVADQDYIRIRITTIEEKLFPISRQAEAIDELAREVGDLFSFPTRKA
jgi:hypothetical protein